MGKVKAWAMELEEEMFDFLETLRESGEINMFAAPQVLVDTFNITKHEAREVFRKWTEER